MKLRILWGYIALVALPAMAIAGAAFDGTYVGPQGGAASNCRGNGGNIALIIVNGLLRSKIDPGNHTIAVDDNRQFSDLHYPLNDPFHTVVTLKAGQIASGAIAGEIDFVGTITCAYKYTATKWLNERPALNWG